MTGKEIDAAKSSLPRIGVVARKDWTEDQRILDSELSCREMINSCLAYGGIYEFWRECEWRFGDKSYAAPYVRLLGIKRVNELVEEQESDFAKATLVRNVFMDSEGLSYNSIKWREVPEL